MQDNPGLPRHSFPAKHTIAHSFFFHFWTAQTSLFPRPLLLLLLPCLRFISMADGFAAELWAYGTFMMRAKPIWDSISCLPALSTLKNHNNTEPRQKFRTHYSLFRSQPRSKPLLRYSAVRSRLCYRTCFLFIYLYFFTVYMCVLCPAPTLNELIWGCSIR